MSLMSSIKRIFTSKPPPNDPEPSTDELLKRSVARKHEELERRLDTQIEVQRREAK